MSVPARAYLSIGEVLSKLRGDFPDVTISKIRFLEAEGLIDPQRTPSGYRKFTSIDLDRLRYVLAAQRDQYLPLRVIKENLDAIDRGLIPPTTPGASATPRLAAVDGELTASHFSQESELRLSRSELLESAGLSEDQLAELESFGLISMKGRFYDADALSVGRADLHRESITWNGAGQCAQEQHAGAPRLRRVRSELPLLARRPPNPSDATTE